MNVNEMVEIYDGRGSMGGMFRYEKFITGRIVKVNEKSISVHMTHVKCTTNGKITDEYDIDKTATFNFWKTVKIKLGRYAGETVDIYKNEQYGIIVIPH